MFDVPYDAACYPGAPGLPPIGLGANCQRYAYAVLGLFGAAMPPLCSSDLWADQSASAHVAIEDVRPLDLMLFNTSDDAWGAHIGVFMGPDQVLHLCQEVTSPAVWALPQFADRARYRTVIGAKRAHLTVPRGQAAALLCSNSDGPR